MAVSRADAIRAFWFGEIDAAGRADPGRAARWFAPDAAFDEEVRRRFEADLRNAGAGHLDTWEREAESSLALVLLLDQFPRNVSRGTPRAFAFDAHARCVTKRLIERGGETELWSIERAFVYMPLQHAEDLADQERSVALFERLRDAAPHDQRETFDSFLHHAEQHRDVIARFGRFPHRNAVLGRAATHAESAWLAEGDRSWGQSG